MGTRADYYVGRGKQAEWIGSTGWDGYPSGRDNYLLTAITEKDFRESVAKTIAAENGSTPETGWPWPWETSHTTDYSYAFDDGKVWCSCYGHEWFDPLEEEPDLDECDGKPTEFPDMKERMNINWNMGPIIVSVKQ